MTPLPKIRHEPNDRENHRAKWWRTNIMHMTVQELARATGYTAPAVYLFENGCTADGKPIKAWVWQRWKLICAAVHAERFGWVAGARFDWQQLIGLTGANNLPRL